MSIKVMLATLTFETVTKDCGSALEISTPIPLLLTPASVLCTVNPSKVTFEAVTLNPTRVLLIVILGLFTPIIDVPSGTLIAVVIVKSRVMYILEKFSNAVNSSS